MGNGLDAVLNQVFNEDCLDGMRKLPNDSIDLVVIDPPYNIKKAEWDTWETVSAYVEFMGKVFKEIERVLKPTGSFYFFHNDFLQTVELQNYLNNETAFKFKNLIIWDKFNGTPHNQLKAIVHSNGTRKYPKLAEYCLFYTLQEDALKDVLHNPNSFREFRNYAKKVHIAIGQPSQKRLKSEFGKAYFDHFFRYNSTQFALPTKANYERLVERYGLESYDFYVNYDDLKSGYETERVRQEHCGMYTFNNQKTNASVWQYGIPENGGHITPKPVDLVENIIKHSSNPGDVVLDCFMGSGTTAIACLNTKRNYIGFELDETYHALLTERINAHITQNTEVPANA